MDRIDIHVEVPAVPYKDLLKPAAAESSKAICKRVTRARQIQSQRFSRALIHCNAQMSSRHIKSHCLIDADSRRLLQAAIDTLGLSARAYNRVLKIARTIADLAGQTDIGAEHISEAIQYRNLDRGKR
jgi:magnesium chelatase family protein